MAQLTSRPKTKGFIRWIAGFGLAIVAVGSALLILRGGLLDARIIQTFPADGGEVSARGRIGVTFDQAMRVDTFANRFQIQPDTPGKIDWEENTLWFAPEKAMKPGVTYTVQIKPGGVSKAGRPVNTTAHFSFHVRPAQVLYLSLQDQKTDLWRQPVTGAPVQLTRTGGNVFDYKPSVDGEQIVYSVSNDQRGMDLWLIRRDGSQNRMLVNCGPDRCAQAAWAPDGKKIVYARQQSKTSLASGGPQGGLYALDLASGQSSFLFPGANPSWSPDGQWLISSDPAAGLIGLTNQSTGEQVQLKGSASQVPTWSPDGSRMIYSVLETAVGIPQENIFEIDFKNKKVNQMWKEDVNLVEYSLPVISPDGQWLVASLHPLSSGQTKQLWLMDSHGKKVQAITQDELLTNSSYSWDPWGGSVLFQQFRYGDSNALPQVMLWDRQTGQIRQIAKGAALPAWLP